MEWCAEPSQGLSIITGARLSVAFFVEPDSKTFVRYSILRTPPNLRA